MPVPPATVQFDAFSTLHAIVCPASHAFLKNAADFVLSLATRLDAESGLYSIAIEKQLWSSPLSHSFGMSVSAFLTNAVPLVSSCSTP